jgi:hypothetical protein
MVDRPCLEYDLWLPARIQAPVARLEAWLQPGDIWCQRDTVAARTRAFGQLGDLTNGGAGPDVFGLPEELNAEVDKVPNLSSPTTPCGKR